jgi:hypothetical protein
VGVTKLGGEQDALALGEILDRLRSPMALRERNRAVLRAPHPRWLASTSTTR